MMAGSLHLIAAKGTDNLSETVETQQRVFNHFLNALETDDVAARVLRGAGLLTLREQAGYIPNKDPRPARSALPPTPDHHQQVYSLDVLRYLGMIFWDNYNEVYGEWLHWVALKNIICPYEALPLMLTLATWNSNTRALTKRVIGHRGKWLVEQSGNKEWFWAKHIKPARRPRLTKYEKNEARVIMRLEQVRFRRIPLEVSFELRLMTFPWSRRFSMAIARTIHTMLDLRDRIASADLARIADNIKWHIHPSQHETITQSFRTYNQFEETQYIADDLDELLTFRANMTALFDRLQ